MDEAGDEAIMLYMEQETIIPANTMRVCKVTSRGLCAHEGRLFWLRSMTNEIRLVAAQAMAPVDNGALWIPISMQKILRGLSQGKRTSQLLKKLL